MVEHHSPLQSLPCRQGPLVEAYLAVSCKWESRRFFPEHSQSIEGFPAAVFPCLHYLTPIWCHFSQVLSGFFKPNSTLWPPPPLYFHSRKFFILFFLIQFSQKPLCSRVFYPSCCPSCPLQMSTVNKLRHPLCNYLIDSGRAEVHQSKQRWMQIIDAFQNELINQVPHTLYQDWGGFSLFYLTGDMQRFTNGNLYRNFIKLSFLFSALHFDSFLIYFSRHNVNFLINCCYKKSQNDLQTYLWSRTALY